MTIIFSIAGLLSLGVALLIFTQNDRQDPEQRSVRAWSLGGIGVVCVLVAALTSGDSLTVFRAVAMGALLASMPFGARMLYPEGIDLIDTAVTAVVGFTIAVSSWELAWRAVIAAAVIAGTYAAIDLIRHNDQEKRIPFDMILVTVAIAATVVT